jgi:lysophospholipase L1-like esterase
MTNTIRFVLLGDSDISRWSPELYPRSDNNDKVTNLGQSGAVLSELLLQLKKWRLEEQESPPDYINIFIACAGENDISSGRSVDSILQTFRSFLDELFQNSQQQQNETKIHLIFLGPKFEPWLSADMSSRKQYTKLSNAFERTIRKHPGFATNRMVFIDCLTMFCTSETSSVPGAVHGGRAMPDETYFDEDGLHLSEAGYLVWKQIVEEQLGKMSTNVGITPSM